MIKLRTSFLLLLLAIISLSSCLKPKYDNPDDTSGYDPHLPVNATLAQVVALGTTNVIISADLTVAAIVAADDRSGNFYKQLVVEDSTGGITLLMDANSLYNHYPVGRKIYIKCKGLYVGNYHGLPQLGYTPDNTGALTGVPAGLFNTYIVKANYPNKVPETTVSLANVSSVDPSLINKLVKIENTEFSSASAAQPYAAPSSVASGTSLNVEDCNGNVIILRTSGYANFQPIITPTGKGSITGIYTVYGNTPQLVIRDTSDVQFKGSRCNGSVISSLVPLDTVLNQYKGGSVKLGAYKISGVVISDITNKNVPSGNVILQCGNKGIDLYFGGTPIYNLGDSIVLDVAGATLDIYSGTKAYEIALSSSNQPAPVATGKTVTPHVMTISDLNNAYSNDPLALDFTLIKIVNATGTGTTYGKGINLNDGTGSVKVYTSSSATFSGITIPGGSHTWVGYTQPYNGAPEMIIRNTADVQ